MPYTHHNHTSCIPHTSISVPLAPSHHHTLSATHTTVHSSQSQLPLHPHKVPRQPHIQTKDDRMTTDTTQIHRNSSKRERNLIILQVNINRKQNKLEELKLLIHNPHADIITIQETTIMQYTTLRTATGCTQDTNIHHIHDETLILPIHKHLQLHAS